MGNQRNYQKLMEEIIEKLGDVRPKLLLHSCCAPCSSATLERLYKHFDITVFYYNPNISPKEEFDKRAIELEKLLQSMEILEGKVKVVIPEYNEQEFFDKVKGLENEPEGGKRCKECFELRLFATANYAKENGFDYFTTTLSISPHKNSEALNQIGEEIGKNVGISYLYADFKKKEGYKRSIELSKEYGLYRQDYCGCIFSKNKNS